MFTDLSDRFTRAVKKIRGVGRLTDKNITSTLREIRTALLDADVALPVVKDFIQLVRTKALGKSVIGNIRPGDALVKVVEKTLVDTLGDQDLDLNLKTSPPAIILLAGLQGAGKTTTAAKLAHWLMKDQKKRVMLASTDVYRPAAIEQLETLATQVEATFFPSTAKEKPLKIAKKACKEAEKMSMDVLIIDTAGRTQIDEAMMQEMSQMSDLVKPIEILLVVDSMTGQNAAHIAKSFNDALPLTGVILTKTDGDARGGAALSMKMITEKPIKFVGISEKIDGLRPFQPKRIASQILGMGDILSLVEDAKTTVDKKEADRLAKKNKKGQRFTFIDLLKQLKQMQKMGGLKGMMSKLPNMGGLSKMANALMDDQKIIKMEAIIQSMTPKERNNPDILNGSRKRRLAAGSGTQLQDVNRLIKLFTQMQKSFKKMKGDKFSKNMHQMQGQLPPELLSQLPDDLK